MATPAAETIDAYIAQFPEEIQALLQKVRETIRKAAPKASEKIAWQMPTFYLNGNLVHFAAFKHHIGFYPTPSGIEAFADEVAGYQSTKGAIQFPYNQPIPYALIGKMVKFRVKENLAKGKK